MTYFLLRHKNRDGTFAFYGTKGDAEAGGNDRKRSVSRVPVWEAGIILLAIRRAMCAWAGISASGAASLDERETHTKAGAVMWQPAGCDQ